MSKFIELIGKYFIEQSDVGNYNPPSYIWLDNVGELIRCKDCKKRKNRHKCPMMRVDWTADLDGAITEVMNDYTIDDGFCHLAEKERK